jgi:hypothetical protein
MESEELVPVEDSGLTSQQIIALDKLSELGAEPATVNAAGKTVYSEDAKIRAYQLIFEGKFGGSGRGQGRPRKQRAAEALADHIRGNLTTKMKRALERALDADEGSRTNLEALKLAIDIERGERRLQIEEEEHDGNLGDTKEELLSTLFALVGDPATAAAIEGSAEDITDAEVVEAEAEFAVKSKAENEAAAQRASAAGTPRGHRIAARVVTNGSDAGSSGQDGREGAAGDRQEGPDAKPKASIRRAAERRRAARVG